MSTPADLTTATAPAIGDALYRLMLQPHGATAEGIEREPVLMGLRSVVVSTATRSPRGNETTALDIREFLKDVTKELAPEPAEQEPGDDEDLGAAARWFLALAQGAGSLLLKDRRERASLYTNKSVRTMAKSQARPYRPSHERRLMDALAERVVERERRYLEGLGGAGGLADAAALDYVRDAWVKTGQLSEMLWRSTNRQAPSLPEIVAMFCVFEVQAFSDLWSRIPVGLANLDVEAGHIPDPEDNPALHLCAMRELSPYTDGDLRTLKSFFDEDERHQRGLEMSSEPDREESQLERLTSILLSDRHGTDSSTLLVIGWADWLATCQCSVAQPDPLCRVHRFRAALTIYRDALKECWSQIRDPASSILSFRNTEEICSYYGLACPP